MMDGGRQEKMGNLPVLFLLKSLLFSYILTGGLLLLLALLLYKADLSQKLVSIGIIVIYVLATFFAGFITGKRLKNKRFLWGALMGAAYFVVLAVRSYQRSDPDTDLFDLLTALITNRTGSLAC